MKRVYKAPEEVPFSMKTIRVFLAGSIEMGKAVDWQTELTNKILSNPNIENVIITNPRRDDWDSSWEQTIENQQFNIQVNWELDNIDEANIVVFVFDKNTASPITLLELGIVSQTNPSNAVVLCPEGYFRKGNVDIVCERSGIEQVNSLDEVVNYIELHAGIYNKFWKELEDYNDFIIGKK